MVSRFILIFIFPGRREVGTFEAIFMLGCFHCALFAVVGGVVHASFVYVFEVPLRSLRVPWRSLRVRWQSQQQGQQQYWVFGRWPGIYFQELTPRQCVDVIWCGLHVFCCYGVFPQYCRCVSSRDFVSFIVIQVVIVIGFKSR